MHILIIGYSMPWHHSKHLEKWLRENKNIVDWIDITLFHSEDEGKSICSLNKDYDLVFCFQSDTRLEFEKKSNKTKIVAMCGETYFPPGAMNPDFIAVFCPEMINKFLKFHPATTRSLWRQGKVKEFPQPINPSLYKFDEPKTLKGIHFKGWVDIRLGDQNDSNGGGNFRLFREAYKERKEFLVKYSKWVKYHTPDYDKSYADWISTVEATITAPAYMSYSDKRRFENMAAGCINIFYIRDAYELQYLEEMGFKHCINCFFFIEDDPLFRLSEFYTFKKGELDTIRKSAYKLLMERYSLDVVVSKILIWIDSFTSRYVSHMADAALHAMGPALEILNNTIPKPLTFKDFSDEAVFRINCQNWSQDCSHLKKDVGCPEDCKEFKDKEGNSAKYETPKELRKKFIPVIWNNEARIKYYDERLLEKIVFMCPICSEYIQEGKSKFTWVNDRIYFICSNNHYWTYCRKHYEPILVETIPIENDKEYQRLSKLNFDEYACPLCITGSNNEDKLIKEWQTKVFKEFKEKKEE